MDNCKDRGAPMAELFTIMYYSAECEVLETYTITEAPTSYSLTVECLGMHFVKYDKVNGWQVVS